MRTQERFLALVGPESGAQAWTQGCFEPMHCGFGKGSAPIMMEAFPSRLAQETNAIDGPVSVE